MTRPLTALSKTVQLSKELNLEEFLKQRNIRTSKIYYACAIDASYIVTFTLLPCLPPDYVSIFLCLIMQGGKNSYICSTHAPNA